MKLINLFLSGSLYGAINNKGILGIAMIFSPILSFTTSLLHIKFIGFTINALIFLTVLIILDCITGIIASKYEKKKLTSTKGLRSIHKFISYFVFLCGINLLQGMLLIEGHTVGIIFINQLRIIVFVLIFLWEWHSIGENYERRFGIKPKIFTFIDKLGDILEKKIAKKIEQSSICPTDSKDKSIKPDTKIS